MKKIILAACLMAALIGSAYAGESVAKERNWGFGWDDGLVLRRNFDLWQVGVSAGPNDRLTDSYTHRSGTALPDSLQGFLAEEIHYRTESGFVALHVARELTEYRNLKLLGLVTGRYTWIDDKDEVRRYEAWNGGFYVYSTERFTELYRLMLGIRLAWFPVDFISLETEFGLMYTWSDQETKYLNYSEHDEEWTSEFSESSSQAFDDFGPYDLTTDIQLILWF